MAVIPFVTNVLVIKETPLFYIPKMYVLNHSLFHIHPKDIDTVHVVLSFIDNIKLTLLK